MQRCEQTGFVCRGRTMCRTPSDILAVMDGTAETALFANVLLKKSSNELSNHLLAIVNIGNNIICVNDLVNDSKMKYAGLVLSYLCIRLESHRWDCVYPERVSFNTGKKYVNVN